jgi:glycosyltransferase involved in cell wall biosynthesis
LNEVAGANIVIIWRAPWDDRVASIVDTAHSNGALVVFDVDDLMIDPELARVEMIDAIRTMRLSEEDIYAMYKNVQKTMLASDVCTATTVELASHIRRFQKTCYVVPNCFDETTWSASRLAVRRRRTQPSDGLIRIGYAGGTRTHQKDFAVVVDAVADVLRERENCRLVLFRSPGDKQPVVYAEEFASLSGLEHQIEWRDLVPLRELPEEMARFDINLAPLEVGNPFCEAKSELKFFEAALVDVCTIASPTGPFKRAIRDGINGCLATDRTSWYTILLCLVDDPALRSRISHAAYYDALQMFGPRRLTDETGSLLEQLKGGESAARAFELSLLRGARGLSPAPKVPESEVMFATDCLQAADVTVVIPLYNYAHYVTEALNSVYGQTLKVLDLIIVDDQSNDESLSVALEWARRNAGRFNRIQVLRNRVNSGLGLTRNTGFEAAETPFVLPLDADNRLLPECCEACLQEIRKSNAAFAYPTIRQFGNSMHLMGTSQYWPQRLAGGNYIDAMALISKSAWVQAGGYDRMVHNGWEDYDFWCRLAERGLFGHSVDRVLAEYRVHEQSMLRTTTDPGDNKRRLIADVHQRHAWVTVPGPISMQKSMISAAASSAAASLSNTNAPLFGISLKSK